MARQLSLIDTPPEWRLSPETKEIARRGLAAARAALAAGRRSEGDRRDAA